MEKIIIKTSEEHRRESANYDKWYSEATVCPCCKDGKGLYICDEFITRIFKKDEKFAIFSCRLCGAEWKVKM